MLKDIYIIEIDYNIGPINPNTGNPESILLKYEDNSTELINFEKHGTEVMVRLQEQADLNVLIDTKINQLCTWQKNRLRDQLNKLIDL